MILNRLSRTDWIKAFGCGLGTALILSAIMIPVFRAGLSPMPKPLGLAFAQKLSGAPLPLPAGLAFHLVWVTLWSVIFIVLFRNRLSFGRAAAFAAVLWLLVLVVFFPYVGWGFFGLAIGPKLILSALLTHGLFAVILWALCRSFFGSKQRQT